MAKRNIFPSPGEVDADAGRGLTYSYDGETLTVRDRRGKEVCTQLPRGVGCRVVSGHGATRLYPLLAPRELHRAVAWLCGFPRALWCPTLEEFQRVVQERREVLDELRELSGVGEDSEAYLLAYTIGPYGPPGFAFAWERDGLGRRYCLAGWVHPEISPLYARQVALLYADGYPEAFVAEVIAQRSQHHER